METPDTTLGMLRRIGFAHRKAAEEWVRERGLSVEQGFTLGWLVDNPGAIQRDIVEMTGTSAASVSSLVQGLEKRGLVERRSAAGDDRSKRVYSLPAGSELVSGFDVAMAVVDETILSPLDEADQATLRDLLSKVVSEISNPTRG